MKYEYGALGVWCGGKPKYSHEKLDVVPLCLPEIHIYIHPIWTRLGSNPGLHVERLAPNCPIYDTTPSTRVLLWSHSGTENEVIHEWIKQGRKWTGAWKRECSWQTGLYKEATNVSTYSGILKVNCVNILLLNA
jgi:hypothetical protein